MMIIVKLDNITYRFTPASILAIILSYHGESTFKVLRYVTLRFSILSFDGHFKIMANEVCYRIITLLKIVYLTSIVWIIS